MAKMTFTGFNVEDKLEKLETGFRREVTHKVLWAGSKVLEKEMKNAISQNHHVITGSMRDSVAATEIVEDLDSSSVEVFTQGIDSRGVSNEMKNKIINYGFYNKAAHSFRKQTDPYLRKLRKRLEPRLQAVMSEQFSICMEEAGLKEE